MTCIHGAIGILVREHITYMDGGAQKDLHLDLKRNQML
jgi:hypothetical protein